MLVLLFDYLSSASTQSVTIDTHFSCAVLHHQEHLQFAIADVDFLLICAPQRREHLLYAVLSCIQSILCTIPLHATVFCL